MNMNKEDLTNYSDNELSLRVFNEEDLYYFRHTRQLEDIINERFVYTDFQYAMLLGDLTRDLSHD